MLNPQWHWRPLQSFFALSPHNLENYMFMATVREGIRQLFLYKHYNTKRYLALDTLANPYSYTDSGYIPTTRLDAMRHVES